MIGRLKKVPVSEMYGAGGSNFTGWLQQNLDVLNEALDISLSGVQDQVAKSSAQLVARDGSGGTVVIENEPSESGDEGLGRLLSSLASVRARTGVWIAAGARPEHVAAVSWLNETSQASFYLLNVEAYRIDDSAPAPVMSLVVGPPEQAGAPTGDGATVAPASAVDGASSPADPAPPVYEAPPVDAPYPGDGSLDETEMLVADPATGDVMDLEVVDVSPGANGIAEPASEVSGAAGAVGVATREEEPRGGRDTTGLMIYQFWTELLEKAGQRTRLHAETEPSRGSMIGTSAGMAGVRYNYVVRENDASVELYVDRGEGRENDTIFNALQVTEDAISYNFGGPLEWRQVEGSDARRIEHVIETGGLRDEERWPEIQDAMIDAMIRLDRALRPHVSRIQL